LDRPVRIAKTGLDKDFVARKAAQILVGRRTVPLSSAVLQFQGQQLAQQDGADRTAGVAEKILQARSWPGLPMLPACLEGLATLLDLRHLDRRERPEGW